LYIRISIFFSSVEDAFKFVNTKQITVRNNKKSPDEVTISIKDIETVSTMLGSIMWDDIPFQEKLPISKDNPLHIIAETITVVQNDMINLREQENQQKIKLAKSKEELQMQKMQKLESLGVLAGGIAHDFNNLLGGIFGYIEAANKYSQDDNVSDYLTKTLNTIDRARGLTSQLLTFAKGGAPVKKIAPLFPFIRESVQFILSGSNISCHFDIAEDLWLCDFDKNQIGQLIDNLIINAQQAMPDGGTIEISAKNVTLGKNEHTTLPAGNYVNLSIKDCGTGISKEIQPHIFDPFYTTQKTGHGLGLSTCYSIINRHRGCINVKSEPGKGSTFLVYLVATAEAISSKAPEPSIHHKGSGMILVMDDEKMICEVVGDMLKTLGYSVECKKNGREAIDFFLSETKANRKIVAIILDLTIQGGMGGKEVVKKIREVDTTIPVFVASGYANDTIMANPAKYGFTGSISKPFNTNDIAKLLNKYLPSTST
jgi:signal transduction histidine kinase/CheY-like chemotaxis protein